MQKIKSSKFVIISLATAVLVLVVLYFLSSRQKIVYVDNQQLFEKFMMTKEMKRLGEKEFNNRKIALDSLYLQLQSQAIPEGVKKELMQKFIQGKEDLEQFNQGFARQESSKIWSRINTYTQEYARDQNYLLVLGLGTSGAVLYADEKIDITNELVQFINKKYEGL